MKFNITGRQVPLFSLTELADVSDAAENIFGFRDIEHQYLKAFDLQTSARAGEINSKIFFAESVDYSINFEKYAKKLCGGTFLDSVKNTLEVKFDQKVEVLSNRSAYVASEASNELATVLINFEHGSNLPSNLPPGGYYCVWSSQVKPSQFDCFVGFTADVSVQTSLNEFEQIKMGFSHYFGYLKF